MTLHFPLPSTSEWPSCQYDHPARCIWLTCSSLHNGPESVTLRPSLPLALWHMGPDSKCHVTSPHGIKAPLRAGNPNRWLKCLQKDSPRQPGRCTEPCRWWWVATYAQQKTPKGREVPAPTETTECWFKCWVSAALDRVPFAFAKYLLNPWSQCLVSWTFKGSDGKLFIYIEYFITKQMNGERSFSLNSGLSLPLVQEFLTCIFWILQKHTAGLKEGCEPSKITCKHFVCVCATHTGFCGERV